MNLTKTLKIVSAVAALTVAGTAQAGFVYYDTASPTGSTSIAVPAINDFRSQLSAAGVTRYRVGRSLGLSGVGAGAEINVDFFGAEAAYRNQFRVGSTTVIDNQGNRSWQERDYGNFAATNGRMDFRFCAVTIGSCITNSQNDSTTSNSVRSIGMWISADGNTAWLLWDDSGAGPDDNHDDMIVRLTIRSVPEPGTLAMLGVGLIGIGIMRRKRAVTKA